MIPVPRRPRLSPSTSRLALVCAGLLCVDAVALAAQRPHGPHGPRAASAPSTAQILAPSAATVPDALPPATRVYRCGSTYSARPCDAAQQPLAVADPRSKAQRRQSDDVTARAQRLAAWYAAGRRERERPPSAVAVGRAAPAPAACTSTIMMSCVPKKPRRRVLRVPGGATAALPGKAKN